MSANDAVIGTNDDAASCKRFAVEKGYWSDSYIAEFVQKSSVRRAPEISRGYYARVKSIEILVKKFLTLTQGKCQIVSLGAGFDTLYWRLHDEDLLPQCYVEVDFEQVTSKKCNFIKTKKRLLEPLSGEDSEIMISKSELHSANYHLVSTDLRNFIQLEAKLSASGVNQSLPTLFLSECVLVYIDTEANQKLIKGIADSFPTAFFVNYEQVNMTDTFGQMMVQNLRARDCVLSGVSSCSSLETQMNRFLNNGWMGGDALDLCTVYKCLPQADVQRMERLELLDEKELLDQLLSHYCLVWAYKDTKGIGLHTISLS